MPGAHPRHATSAHAADDTSDAQRSLSAKVAQRMRLHPDTPGTKSRGLGADNKYCKRALRSLPCSFGGGASAAFVAMARYNGKPRCGVGFRTHWSFHGMFAQAKNCNGAFFQMSIRRSGATVLRSQRRGPTRRILTRNIVKTSRRGQRTPSAPTRKSMIRFPRSNHRGGIGWQDPSNTDFNFDSTHRQVDQCCGDDLTTPAIKRATLSRRHREHRVEGEGVNYHSTRAWALINEIRNAST